MALDPVGNQGWKDRAVTAHRSWRVPTAEEFPIGLAELGKLVGETEANHPLWLRRFCVSEPDGEWCLTVEAGGAPTGKLVPWADPVQLQAFPTAYPLAEAVKILQGPNNPEEVLRQRREACKAHEAEQAADKAKKLADERAAKERQLKWEDDCRRFNEGAWNRLEPIVQFCYALALKVQDRDAALAADLRALAGDVRRIHPAHFVFPAREWERGQ